MTDTEKLAAAEIWHEVGKNALKHMERSTDEHDEWTAWYKISTICIERFDALIEELKQSREKHASL